MGISPLSLGPELAGVPDIVVVGSFSYDHLSNPFYGECWVVGGAGAYLSLGAAVAGSRVGVVGILPKNVDMKTVMRIAEKIDLTGLEQRLGVDIAFDIEYDSHWNATYHVDNAVAEDTLSFSNFPDPYKKAKAVHLCPLGSVETQLHLATTVRESINVLLSATTFKGHVLKESTLLEDLLQNVDVFFVNEEEALLLSSKNDLDDACTYLQRLAGQTVVCVTQAAEGVTVLDNGVRRKIAAYPTIVKDPTGAGESFAGAFMATYLQKRDSMESAMVATCVASSGLEDWGIDGLLRADPDTIQYCLMQQKSRLIL